MNGAVGKIPVLILASLAVLPAGARAQAAPTPEEVARQWSERMIAVMEQDADSADLERVLELYHADAVYEHPRFGARIEGLEAIRSGMAGFLGVTRRPSVAILSVTSGEGVAVLKRRVAREVLQDGSWSADERTSVTVFEVRDGRIVRMIDYW